MIIFDQLGQLGRLGNQLFQIAATLTHAQRVEDQPAFNHWECNSCFAKQLSELDRNESGKLIVNGIEHKMVHHTQFHYEPIPFEKNLYLLGFFQSEKYFDQKIVREYFSPSIDQEVKVVEASNKIFGQSIPPYGTMAIHVRRGDYVNSGGFHNILPIEYYMGSFQKLQEIAHCSLYCKPHTALIFSDDIPFCKQHFQWLTVSAKVNTYYVEGNDVVTDLLLAANCGYFIISNSSLAWWMAYLAKLLYSPTHYIVFAPRQWFGEKVLNVTHFTKDLYCKGWNIF